MCRAVVLEELQAGAGQADPVHQADVALLVQHGNVIAPEEPRKHAQRPAEARC